MGVEILTEERNRENLLGCIYCVWKKI